MSSDDSSAKTNLGFEDAYRRLQEVVERLEKGNLLLDEGLALFEEGTQLLRHCSAVLNEAELKVTVLTVDLEAELNQGRRSASAYGYDADDAEGDDTV